MGVRRRDGFFFFSYGFGNRLAFCGVLQFHHPGSFTGLKSVKCNNFLILQTHVVVARAYRELSCRSASCHALTTAFQMVASKNIRVAPSPCYALVTHHLIRSKRAQCRVYQSARDSSAMTNMQHSPLQPSKHVVYLSHVVILAKRFDTNMTTIQPNPPSEHDMRHLVFTLLSLYHPPLDILSNLVG
jgi:galactokinase